MTQKIIEVIGTSKESFCQGGGSGRTGSPRKPFAASSGRTWIRFDLQLDGAKVLQYRATTRIYFDVEH